MDVNGKKTAVIVKKIIPSRNLFWVKDIAIVQNTDFDEKNIICLLIFEFHPDFWPKFQ
jgi:hypothetical protein